MLTLRLALTENKYREDRQVAGFYREVLERLAALPGVRSAVAVTALPYSRHWSMLPVTVEGRPLEPGKAASAQVQSVSADYFAAMFIPLRAGRLPGAADAADRPRVAVVSERMARQWWPAGRSPIGSRLRIGDKGPRPWVTIVGVVGDIEHSVIDRDLTPAVYLPMAQAPEREMDIGIRTAVDAGQPRAGGAGSHSRGGRGAAGHEPEYDDEPDPAGGLRVCVHGGADGRFRPAGAGAFRGRGIRRDGVGDFVADA